MSTSLVFSVRLHEGWYHGADGKPSPARFFQALVAGRGLSGPLPPESVSALEWLEQLPPPIVALPAMQPGQQVTNYVPNNDLDAKQGDHRRVGEIRTKKIIRPLLFDAEVPFIYCWSIPAELHNESAIIELRKLADSVFQFGRTVDTGWAWAEELPAEDVEELLSAHRGSVRRPSSSTGSVEYPKPGSLASLKRRHNDMASRYHLSADRKGQTFTRRAKPRWGRASYDNAAVQVCFDLTDRQTGEFQPWPLTGAMPLVIAIRDQAVDRLVESFPDRELEIQQALVGRRPDGKNAGRTSARIRMIPLPSIGHSQTSQDIRRILIEIPSDCLLRSDDVTWAFSAQEHEIHGRKVDLVRSQAHQQLKHYGIESGRSAATWQTVTPLALTAATRRRIEPDTRKRVDADKKATMEKRAEQMAAESAIRRALRHSGIDVPLESVRVQREPFTARGSRTNEYDAAPRFSHHALWHAELEFEQPIQGPLVLGDGRFMGLGLLRPSASRLSPLAFLIGDVLPGDFDAVALTDSFRRAVMACVRNHTGSSRLDPYVTGHNRDGSPTKRERQPHVAYACDPTTNRLLIFPPQTPNADRFAKQHHAVESATRNLKLLHSASCGSLKIIPVVEQYSADHLDRLTTTSAVWTSLTPYFVSRFAKKTTAEDVIRLDVMSECKRHGLPRPIRVDIDSRKSSSGKGLSAMLTVAFKCPVSGPMLLGKTRHKGGGLFSGMTVEPKG